MVDPLLGFPDMSYLQSDPMLLPKKPTLASFLADLDAEIESRAEELKAFDTSGPDLALPRQPMPSTFEAIGAALSNIVQPGAAQEFAQYANQVKRTNTQIAMQEAVAARDAVREELFRKFGLEKGFLDDAMKMRSELRMMQLKSDLGIGGMDSVTLRNMGSEIMKTIEAGTPVDIFLNDRNSLGVLKWQLSLGPDSTVEDVRQAIQARQDEAAREEARAEEGRRQGRQRIAIAENRYNLSKQQFAELQTKNTLEAAQEFSGIRSRLIDIETAVGEAQDKLTPGALGKLIKKLRGEDVDAGFTDAEYKETIRLKTKQGDVKYTLRQLESELENLQNLQDFYLSERTDILPVLRGGSAAVQQAEPATPQVQQPAPTNGSLPSPADVLRFGG